MEISRQLKWQRKQKELGNCTTCGKKSAENKHLCADCNIKRREYMRKKFGYNPKQEGKVGRRIKYKD